MFVFTPYSPQMFPSVVVALVRCALLGHHAEACMELCPDCRCFHAPAAQTMMLLPNAMLFMRIRGSDQWCASSSILSSRTWRACMV